MEWWRHRSNCRRLLRGESGLTLTELLAVVAILGVIATIAVIWLLAWLDARRVEAAARQLAADLRLAHTSATTQLADWRLIYAVDGSEYHLVKLDRECAAGCEAVGVSVDGDQVEQVFSRELPRGTKIVCSSNGSDPANYRAEVQNLSSVALPEEVSTIEFNPDGTSYAARGPNTGLRVASESRSRLYKKLTVMAATSRVSINDGDCSGGNRDDY